MVIEPEISGASIVLVGKLNPHIFTPDWLLRHQLIGESDAASAEVKVIHPEISVIEFEWMSVRVERERFVVDTSNSPFVRIYDFTVSIFRQLLSHTPIQMLGINRLVHFDAGSFDQRNLLGRKLAPVEPWGEWAKELDGISPEEYGGLNSMTMRQNKVPDRKKGSINAKIEPSTRILNGVSGVFMQINDHYELDTSSDPNGCDEIITVLEKQFDLSIKRSEWIINQIMKIV